jgi:acyl carrier protein
MPDISSEAVLEQLQPIFDDVLNEPGLVVTRSLKAVDTRNWDSLAHIDLIEAIAGHFKIRFALGELQELKEVGDLVDLIVKKVKAKG